MSNAVGTWEHASQGAEGAIATRGHRVVLWMAVLVIGFAFYSPDYQVLLQPEANWTFGDAADAQEHQMSRVVTRGLAYLALLGFGTWALLSKNDERLAPRGPLIPLMVAYLGWSLFSVAWSHDPIMSLMRWIQLACLFVAALGMARKLSPRDFCLLVLSVFTLYVVLGVCAEFAYGVFQPWAYGYRFSGGEHPNSQADNCLYVCLAAVALLADPAWPRWRSFLFLVPAAVLLVLTGSRTALAAGIVAVVLCWLLFARPQARLLLAVAIPTVLLAAGMLLTFATPKTHEHVANKLLLGRQEDTASLSGRLPLWSELLQFVEQRPIAGFGYGGFWNVEHKDEIEARLDWVVPSAHNAFIEALLNVGIIGAGIFTALAVIGWWTSAARFAALPESGYAFEFMLLTVCAVGAFVESIIATGGVAALLTGIAIVHLADARPPGLARNHGLQQGIRL